MTIRHLKTFIKVCELGSISKAAEYLCITQPSVSQTIKELEAYYKIGLFDRAGKRLILTKEGQQLLPVAKEVINSFDAFEFIASKADYSPKVSIGATMTFGTLILPNLIADIKKQLPNLDPFFFIGKIQDVEEKIINGDLDFAIAEGLVASKSIEMIVFGTDNLVVVAGNEYPVPDKIKLEDLIKYDLLIREKGSAPRNILDNALAEKGIRIINPRMESVSNMIIISIAIQNNGIGILPYDIVKKYLDAGLIREIKIDTKLERKLCLIYHKNKRFTSVAKKTFDICHKILIEK